LATNVKRDLKDLCLTCLETPVLPLDTPVTVHVRKSWQNHDGPKTGAQNRNTGRGIENKLVWSTYRNWSRLSPFSYNDIIKESWPLPYNARISKKERGGGHETSDSPGFKMAKLEQKKFAHRRGVDLFFSNGPKVLQALSPFEFKSNFFSKDSTAKDLQWRGS